MTKPRLKKATSQVLGDEDEEDKDKKD